MSPRLNQAPEGGVTYEYGNPNYTPPVGPVGLAIEYDGDALFERLRDEHRRIGEAGRCACPEHRHLYDARALGSDLDSVF